MKPLLIVPAPQGQLANRLFNLAHIRAFAIEQKLPMVHCAFHPYADLFTGPKKSLFCLYDPDGNFLTLPQALRLAHMFRQFTDTLDQSTGLPGAKLSSNYPDASTLDKNTSLQMREEFFAFGFVLRSWVQERVFSSLSASYFEMGDQGGQLDQFKPLQEDLVRSEMILLDGWGWRYESGFQKHRAELLKYLELLPEHQASVSKLVATARSKGQMLIGVHVRRGDYKQWLDGKYYYELEVYRNVMQSAVRRYSDKKVCFLVTGTDKMSEADFAGLPVTVSNEQAHIDLYSLAQCDMTVGPPSTYTGWAKYVGQHPHLDLSNPSIIF